MHLTGFDWQTVLIKQKPGSGALERGFFTQFSSYRLFHGIAELVLARPLRARSRSALAAENLFLRKQLAFYQERKVRPIRFDNASRFMLVLLSHGFAWKQALVNVTPKAFIGRLRTSV